MVDTPHGVKFDALLALLLPERLEAEQQVVAMCIIPNTFLARHRLKHSYAAGHA